MDFQHRRTVRLVYSDLVQSVSKPREIASFHFQSQYIPRFRIIHPPTNIFDGFVYLIDRNISQKTEPPRIHPQYGNTTVSHIKHGIQESSVSSDTQQQSRIFPREIRLPVQLAEPIPATEMFRQKSSEPHFTIERNTFRFYTA